MSIILNEIEYAENIIKDNDLGKNPYESLSVVAKYYMHNGYKKEESRRMLINLIKSCNMDIAVVKMQKMADCAITIASKNPIHVIDGINITESEMNRIDSLDGVQLKRLAFTLLCVAKYWISVDENKNYWVGTKDSDIMKMANINTSIERQSLMFSKLRDCGMIRFAKRIDNLNVQVLFADDDSDVDMVITDFRNLGYQYMKRHGAPYFECENCGIVTRMTNPGVGRRQKYCKECAYKMMIQRNVGKVMNK